MLRDMDVCMYVCTGKNFIYSRFYWSLSNSSEIPMWNSCVCLERLNSDRSSGEL